MKLNKNKDIFKQYLPAILGGIFLIGFAIYTILKKGNFQYVYLSTAFDEKVEDVYQEKGNTYLLLSNKDNRYRLENSRNYDYDPVFLHDFLKPNDRVIKKYCSDTIYVQRESLEYNFLIGSSLYNATNKSKDFIEKHDKKRVILTDRNDCK